MSIESDLLRVYLDPADIETWGQYIGYPHAWAGRTSPKPGFVPQGELYPRIPDFVREQAGHRCVRCMHPYVVGKTPGKWSPCDQQCTHLGPVRYREIYRGEGEWTEVNLDLIGQPAGDGLFDYDQDQRLRQRWEYEAQWRVLTVHHLNGIKYDCRWWNLCSLCQRCHLVIQSKVWMDRPWNREHSEWFKPYVAGYYASLEGLELNREETMAMMDELLKRHHTQEGLF